MRARGQFLGTVLVVGLVAAAGVYLQREVAPRALAAPVAGAATTGAWFCPHGGGPAGTKDWHATLAVANPGRNPVRIRVTELGSERPAAPSASVVPPGEEVLFSVPANSPEASTFVEYFGGWVSAGWVMRAQGAISGVAAESCTPQADREWNLPDGDTSLPQGARSLFENGKPVSSKALTDVVLPPMRSVAIPLSKELLGQQAIDAHVRVSVGRVAAATLSTSFVDGIRSAEGIAGTPPVRTFLPAGAEQASTVLAVGAPATSGVQLSASLRSDKTQQLVSGLERESVQGSTAHAYQESIGGPSTFELTTTGQNGIAAAVRALVAGTSHDEASTSGSSVAATAWVVPPAAAAKPARPSILLFDPGSGDAKVTLTALMPPKSGKAPKPVTVTVPAGRTVIAPGRFAGAAPTASVLAVSSGPPVVAASAAFSEGEHGVGGFALSTGVVAPRDGEET